MSSSYAARVRMKRMFAPFAMRVSRNTRRGLLAPILTYHAVCRVGDDGAMPRDTFVRQLDWLIAECEIVPLREIVAALVAGRNYVRNSDRMPVALTFDDGYACNTQTVLPLLRDRELPATAFVLSGLWNRAAAWRNPRYHCRQLWSVDDCLEWHDAGVEIGSHGAFHRNLMELTPSELLHELSASRVLHASLPPAAGFCYPWGVYSSREHDAVRETGYEYAVTTRSGRWHEVGDLWRLARMTVDESDRLRDLKFKIGGGYDWITAVREIGGHLEKRLHRVYSR